MGRSSGVETGFSKSGTPTDNAFAEILKGNFWGKYLKARGLMKPPEAKDLIEAWRRKYNQGSPHASISAFSHGLALRCSTNESIVRALP